MTDEIKEEIKKDEQVNELDECKKKSEEYLNGWKRERADFINYKKEEMERIGTLLKYANEELLLKIIPVLDNIFLAEQHIPEEIKKNKWTEGFGHIKNQLKDFLSKEGIEVIETIGSVFDPNTMEAVGETEGGLNNTVSEEVQRGYTLNGKVIRVAKVKINK